MAYMYKYYFQFYGYEFYTITANVSSLLWRQKLESPTLKINLTLI